MCAPLRGEHPSYAARKALGDLGHEFRCRSDLETLEESISAGDFRWFTAPIRSMLAVRAAHSTAQKERIRKLADGTTLSYHEMGLSKHMTEALDYFPPFNEASWGEFFAAARLHRGRRSRVESSVLNLSFDQNDFVKLQPTNRPLIALPIYPTLLRIIACPIKFRCIA